MGLEAGALGAFLESQQTIEGSNLHRRVQELKTAAAIGIRSCNIRPRREQIRAGLERVRPIGFSLGSDSHRSAGRGDGDRGNSWLGYELRGQNEIIHHKRLTTATRIVGPANH